MKKGLSILLALVLMLSIFTVIPFSVSAREADITNTGTNAIKTQAEAVNWLKSQNNASYNIDTTTGGTQCTEFVRVYVNWIMKGNAWTDAWGGRSTGNGGDIWKNSLWSAYDWKVYNNTAEFVPQPGDIFDAPGHTGVVISSSATSATIADANARNSDPYDGDPVWVHDITWGALGASYYYSPHHFIRPNFAGSNPQPSNAWIKASASSVYTGTSVTFTFGADNTKTYNLFIKKNGADWRWQQNASSGYSITFTEAGTYTAYISANNPQGYILSSEVTVVVSAPPIPGKPTFTEFELHNWSDGSFGWLKLGWTKTANTTAYGIHIYDYNTGAEVKKYSYNDPNCTTATLGYSDIIPGRYYVQIKSYNAYNVTASDKREVTFVKQSTPTSAWVKASRSAVPIGGEINFTFDGENCTSATNFFLIVKKGDTEIFNGSVNLERKTGKTLTFDTEGTYTAFVKAQLDGYVFSDTITFYVFEPVTLGSDFKANMLNAVYSNTQRVLTGSGDSVIVSDKLQNKDEEKWHFELQSDRSYKIMNLKNGKCLDISGGTVKLAEDNGSDDQRFYAVYHYFGFIMVSKSTGSAIDMKGGSVKLNPYDPSSNNVGQPFSVDGYFDTKPNKTMTYNGHTYELYLVRMPWNQAERFCEHKGGHLVTITSAEEQAKVYGMCENSGYAVWLGACDWGREGEWYWVTGEKFEYTNWHADRPTSSANNNCAALYAYDSDDWGHGVWNDWSNVQRISSTGMYIICEYDNGDVNADAYKPVKTVEHNGIKYEVFDANVDWMTAEAICEAKGGYLVLIDNAELNGFVKDMIADGEMDEYWINGTDRFNEGDWSDHTGKVLTYKNWSEKSPQNDFNQSDYAVIMKDGLWRDQKNINSIRNGMIGFICEYTPAPSAIKLNKDDFTLSVGKTYQLTATVTPAKADQTVTWRSSKTSVATVDKDGKVKAVGVGTAIIYAETANGLSAPCIVTVEGSSGIILGDADGDNEVTILDATAIQRHLASLPTSAFNATAADTDNDDEVTILDATAIQRHLASLPTQAQGIGKPIA